MFPVFYKQTNITYFLYHQHAFCWYSIEQCFKYDEKPNDESFLTKSVVVRDNYIVTNKLNWSNW